MLACNMQPCFLALGVHLVQLKMNKAVIFGSAFPQHIHKLHLLGQKYLGKKMGKNTGVIAFWGKRSSLLDRGLEHNARF